MHGYDGGPLKPRYNVPQLLQAGQFPVQLTEDEIKDHLGILGETL